MPILVFCLAGYNPGLIPSTVLRTRIVLAGAAGLAVVIASADRMRDVLQLSGSYLPKAAGLFGIVLAILVARIDVHHPFARLGPAIVTTLARALMVSLVAAFIGEPLRADVAWVAAILALVITLLDGVDGWLARRTRMASDFGARFDMEVDALLIMALAILVWQHGKAGVWVLLSGLIRYAFVAAGWLLRWLARPLPASRRRQTVCVVQVGGLNLALVPAIPPPAATIVSAVALAALVWSFFVDVRWLSRRAHDRV